MPITPITPRSVAESLLCFSRGLSVGAVATLVDLAALTILVRVFQLSPLVANVPALCTGAVVQFLGCRHLVFGAQAGDARKQAALFALTEVGTLAANALAFHLLVAALHVPFVIARPVGTFVVFVGFSYPLWHLTFARSRASDRGDKS